MTNLKSAKNSEHILRWFTAAIVEHILLVDDDKGMSTVIKALVRRDGEHERKKSRTFRFVEATT
jgi:hypothetical protein